MVEDEKAERFNSAVVSNPGAKHLRRYDKLRLVPFSEYHPPGRRWFGHKDLYRHGTEYPVFAMSDRAGQHFRFSTSICYDTCFPELYWRYMHPARGRAPQFFLVPAYEDFDYAWRLQYNLLQQARFRAVECRRAFVRNAHRGYSGMIDGNGVLAAAPAEIAFEDPVVLGRIPLDNRFSFYSAIGDWPAFVLLAIAMTPALLRCLSFTRSHLLSIRSKDRPSAF